jgi:hypothetical protein
LEEAVLGDDETLREEEVVFILRVDVGNSPTVALNPDRLLKAGNFEGSANYG